MKKKILSQKYIAASIAGYENLAVWADLLDRINVFPVADGDTGANLRMSLVPLRECGNDMEFAVSSLALSARGNSGNISVAFFREFLRSDSDGLAEQAKKGRDKAWQAIANPCAGTMLGVFDALCLVLDTKQDGNFDYVTIRKHLYDAVFATKQQLPELKDAGVVDSGALGMFCFFDGFFQQWTGQKRCTTPVIDMFGDALCINSSFEPQATGEYCVEASLATDGMQEDLSHRIANWGNSAVVVPDESGVKLHIHTRNPQQLRDKLSALGEVVAWSDEAIDPMISTGNLKTFEKNHVRIMSDAAGSIPLELARSHGIILLDSYILALDQAKPESLFSSDQLYVFMKEGVRVSTAQASTHERHLHYQAACQQYEKVLYLCTGAAFTGNFSIAKDWQKAHDSDNQFTVIDTGAASGRLALIALLTARFAADGADVEAVVKYAENLTKQAEEYGFIHELKYLVAGGRVSRAKGFFGDLLHMKPVISPGFDGVRKVGVVRNRDAQLDFALTKLKVLPDGGSGVLVLLQHTDNKEWLIQDVEPEIRKCVPEAEILCVPLSLTSGVHMGPGTWSIAFASHGESAC